MSAGERRSSGPFSPRALAAIRRAVTSWSEANGRPLPWRDIGDPYRVWISEIMLQQTTVAAVVPYYERFLQRFPTLESLAESDETDVLRLWEGLGYYSRARNLHRGARDVMDRFHGEIPQEIDQLQSLPGIGRYTAGAIASFAFDRRAPIVEANTLRLFARLLGYEGDPRSQIGQQALWSFAEEILPQSSPGRFNQALMDLGATICVPVEPRCPDCPMQRWCRAFQTNRVAAIPRPASRPAITEVTAFAVALRRDGRYLLRQCRPGERWAGLWDFPRFEIAAIDETPEVEPRLLELVRELTGLRVTLGPQLAQFRHSVTRFRITLNCVTAEFRSGRLRSGETWAWISPASQSEYPLSTTGRKLANRLKSGLF
jgi:A/G-specific adenine glycosylase